MRTALPATLPIGFGAPLPADLVHKADPAEVLLTDLVQTGADRFLVAVHWPGDHRLYGPAAAGPADLFFVAESLRQTVIALSHAFYGIPRDHLFILHGIDLEAPATGTPLRPGESTLALLDVDCNPRHTSRGRFHMVARATVVIDGQPHARASLTWEAVRPAVYARLRSKGMPVGELPKRFNPPVFSPASVGRRFDRDVVLAPGADGESGFRLRMDGTHPVYFDHHSDHIPGMVLLEAFRQVGHLAAAATSPALRAGGARPVLTGLAAGFRTYGALHLPVVIELEEKVDRAADGQSAWLVRAVQEGRTLADGVVLMGGHHPTAPPPFGSVPAQRAAIGGVA